jgi:hypothetical protein
MLGLHIPRCSANYIVTKDGKKTDVVVRKTGSSPDHWVAYRPWDASEHYIAEAVRIQDLFDQLEGKV